ncbi:YtxH domain-containing protein [Streptomyces sp. RB6PN25]|uniref:YtxH domain-containing protein n=1 Tax=Streptomyces humicola TaxID=2953240 RepID=A0ABT1PZR5_9ACTN|nr:YtxH domain-containing protein [Streptomyces humicola]MCQ4082025.1 YtxH domain-containing protein [Streptomyces humicola]
MRYRLTFITGFAAGYVLGARAGRERYEQLRKTAQGIAQNPAVRNTVESAGQQSRAFAAKAAASVTERFGDRLPGPLNEKVRSLREPRGADADDDWGTSNT